MNRLSLILRNVRHHRRRHVGTVLGAATATAILAASMIVGDSVRSSLRTLALRRLGRTDLAAETGDRRFRAALAADAATALGRDTAALLAVPGSASAPDSGLRAPQVALFGADAALDRFADAPPGFGDLAEGEAFVNAPLAQRLGLRAGDPLVLRFARAGALPADVPMGNESDAWTSLRVVVKAVLDDARLGRFSLRAAQAAPLSVFLPREHLAARMESPGRANLLLAAGETSGPTTDPAPANAVLASVRTLADHELELRPLTNAPAGGVELRSARVFLEPAAVEAALAAAPGGEASLTYIVNRLRNGTNSCPYSFVAGVAGAPQPGGMRDDEIAVGEWLAEDLGLAPGGRVALEYFVLGPGQHLAETSREFRVRAVLPAEGAAADPSWMPDFPGIRDAGRCGDWTPGIPLDLKRIRQKDEDYWAARRGTPKAFVTLAAAQSMWSNRFGVATAVRWPGTPRRDSSSAAATASVAATDGRGMAGSDDARPPRPTAAATGEDVHAALAAAILSRLPAASAGLTFRPVRSEGLAAGQGTTDFTGLFIGLGFFILVAALILAAVLFGLALTARAAETGLLRALGYRRGAIRAILLGEAALVAAVAAAAGSAAGIGIAEAILGGLRTLWQGAVGTTALGLDVRIPTVLGGAAAGLVASLGAAFAVLRRQEFRSVHELQSGGAGSLTRRARRTTVRFGLALVCLAASAGLRLASGDTAGPGALLGAGALALTAGLLLCATALARLATGGGTGEPDPRVFGTRNWARRPRRSLAAILMPACGIFLVFAVGANRPQVHDPESRASGTGGFAFLGATALPLARDPGTAEGRALYDLPAGAMDGVRVLALRRRGGDDASCLNLNRVSTPPLIGLPAAMLDGLGAFRFTTVAPGVDPAHPWTCLALDRGPGVLPVVLDESVALWSLKVSVGDRMPVVDEHGRPLQVEIVGLLADSVFQGSLLADGDRLLGAYPSATLQMLLVDAPPAKRDAVRRALEDRLGDLGLDLSTTAVRLDAFLAVQHVYLEIFLAFGAIGLLIGAAGFGVVANRNLIERRREFGLLHALGYPRSRLLRGAVAEHTALAALGLAVGALAAILAIPPAAATLVPLALLLAAMAAVATVTSALSARAVLSTPALEALREE